MKLEPEKQIEVDKLIEKKFEEGFKLDSTDFRVQRRMIERNLDWGNRIQFRQYAQLNGQIYEQCKL